MEIDLTALASSHRYKLLTALVTPRPIAWVTTVDRTGRVNAAPYSFFNVLGNDPPIVAFGPGDRSDGTPKDTPANIASTGEFVVNLVDEACAEAMHACAAALPPDENELEALALVTVASASVRPPRIALSPVQLECRHHSTIEVGENRVIIGIVQHLAARDGLLDPETLRLQPDAFSAIGRLQGPGWYCRSSDRFDLGPFPTAEDLRRRTQLSQR